MGLEQQDSAFKEFEFHVEGVHCANCLRKIDGLKESLAPIEALHFDMSQNRLSFRGPDALSKEKVLEEVSRLGFQGRQFEEAMGRDSETRKENRRQLIRLGVAAVAAGNIMLMSSSIYSGAEGLEAQFMNWISLLLAIPALTYCAWPLYRSAWADLKLRKISVDLPIVVAILAGSALSVYSILNAEGDVYLDSITCLIFLLLGSRYFLSRVQAKYMGVGRLQNLFKIHKVMRERDGQFEEVEVEALFPGDIIRVQENQVLPVDGVLLDKSASLDTSLLSGESRPRGFVPDEKVYMGMKNCGAALRMQVSVRIENSRINKMLKEVEAAVELKPKSIELLDKVGQNFLIVVMLTAAATFLYFMNSNPAEGMSRALALILVACPCTFAFGAPMVFSLGMVRAAKDGLLVKHPSVFEKVREINEFVFDKTGTLTDGRYELQNFEPQEAIAEEDLQRLLLLVQKSEHPVSRAIRDELLRREIKPAAESFSQILEKPTEGLEGHLAGDIYKVNSRNILKNDQTLVTLKMGDKIWPEAYEVIGELQNSGSRVFVLSGDNEKNVQKLCQDLDIPFEQCLSSQSPEMKTEFLNEHPKSLMLGDGANDSLALAKCYVGVAANGSLSSSLRASDVYLMKQDLRLVPQLLNLSNRVGQIIRQNLTTAVIYNVLVGALAVFGYIHPLLAAVLMPLSSLSQLLSSLRILKKGSVWT